MQPQKLTKDSRGYFPLITYCIDRPNKLELDMLCYIFCVD